MGRPITAEMKGAVISCVEPEHLRHCLRALGLWVDPRDVIVVDNANDRANSAHIQGLALVQANAAAAWRVLAAA